MKKSPLEKFISKHRKTCSIFRFSDQENRKCSCGRDESEKEWNKVLAELKESKLHTIEAAKLIKILRAESESRRKTLIEKEWELRKEWTRAENAEAQLAREDVRHQGLLNRFQNKDYQISELTNKLARLEKIEQAATELDYQCGWITGQLTPGEMYEIDGSLLNGLAAALAEAEKAEMR